MMMIARAPVVAIYLIHHHGAFLSLQQGAANFIYLNPPYLTTQLWLSIGKHPSLITHWTHTNHHNEVYRNFYHFFPPLPFCHQNKTNTTKTRASMTVTYTSCSVVCGFRVACRINHIIPIAYINPTIPRHQITIEFVIFIMHSSSGIDTTASVGRSHSQHNHGRRKYLVLVRIDNKQSPPSTKRLHQL